MSKKKPQEIEEAQLKESKKQTELQQLAIIIAVIFGVLSFLGYLSAPGFLNTVSVLGLIITSLVFGYLLNEFFGKGYRFNNRVFALMELKQIAQLDPTGISKEIYENTRIFLIAMVTDAERYELARELKSEKWDLQQRSS